MIGSCAEDPRLFGMEADVKDSEVIDDLVSLEYLHRHDQCVHHQVIVHHPVEDVDGTWMSRRIPSSEQEAKRG
jgi:hypothetical protein